MALSRKVSIKLVLIVAVAGLCIPLGGCTDGKSANAMSSPPAVAANAIDINRASVEELKDLPGIGDAIAARIVDFREKNGPFRRPEQLLLVPGISEKKFREIRPLIKADPSPNEQ